MARLYGSGTWLVSCTSHIDIFRSFKNLFLCRNAYQITWQARRYLSRVKSWINLAMLGPSLPTNGKWVKKKKSIREKSFHTNTPVVVIAAGINNPNDTSIMPRLGSFLTRFFFHHAFNQEASSLSFHQKFFDVFMIFKIDPESHLV